MRLQEWLIWLKRLPLWKKYYIYLVLARPLVDIYWEATLFNIGIQELIGGGFFLFGLINVLMRVGSTSRQRSNLIFNLFSVIYISTSIIFLLFKGISLFSLGIVTKSLSLVIMFYYLKRFIRNLNDFMGILFSFILSAIIPAIIIFYEIFVNPIKLVESRGIQRLEGAFADVLNYSIYCSCAILIAFYFYLRSKKGLGRQKITIALVMVLSIGLFALVKINHMATYGVVAAIIAFFLIANVGKKRILATLFIILTIVFVIYQLRNDYEERLSKNYESELSVIKGERATEQAFHGRAHRWMQFSEYMTKSPYHFIIFGISTASEPGTLKYISGWLHNDYLRLFAYTGLIGLFCYLGFMLTIYLQARKYFTPEKFLIRSAVAMILLYSMSTLPSLYFPLLSVIVPIFILAISPKILK